MDLHTVTKPQLKCKDLTKTILETQALIGRRSTVLASFPALPARFTCFTRFTRTQTRKCSKTSTVKLL